MPTLYRVEFEFVNPDRAENREWFGRNLKPVFFAAKIPNGYWSKACVESNDPLYIEMERIRLNSLASQGFYYRNIQKHVKDIETNCDLHIIK